MKSIDIFALPIFYSEGLPVSIMEAMAYGKPVVSTWHKGSEDIVLNGETGFLVEVNNSDELTEKIIELNNNKNL